MKPFALKIKEPLYHFPMDFFSFISPILYRNSNKIINIGGGPNRNHPREMNLNILLLRNIDIVANAEKLPFKNASLDAIICNAVLEHVSQLDLVISEIERTLKPGGYVYTEVPFIQHYHTSDIYGVTFNDYRRFTKEGISEIFNFCTTIDVGVCVGPTSALIQIIGSYFRYLLPGHSLRRIFLACFNFFGNFIAKIDYLLPQKVVLESSIPSGIYFFGRKRDNLTDFLKKLPQPNSIFPKSGKKIQAQIKLIKINSNKINLLIKNKTRFVWLKESPLPWGKVQIGIQKIEIPKTIIDYKRVPIPRDLMPNEEIEIEISRHEITDGSILKFDIVIEGICWLQNCGNKPLILKINQ